jgi:hypothetical protein
MSLLFACMCNAPSSGVSDGGGSDLAMGAGADLATSGVSADLAASGAGDMTVQQTCTKSCGSNQICVWFACNTPPVQGCVDVTPSCKAAPSCGCFMCQTATGDCSSYQGQIACGPQGTCG